MQMESFDPDHALALLLQARFNVEVNKEREKNKENVQIPPKMHSRKNSLVDPEWEVTDPCPDVHALFLAFNNRFFWGRLLSVEVKWSHQMTSCAGVCVYEGKNGLCSVRLSAPLLKLRPRSDLVETLLHEMIHAYLFVTHNNKDRDGHGPEFHKHMNRINKEAGTNITVFHSFHAEVKLYQQHWWRCNGPCQRKPPFFGMVKRARNRVPGPNDLWWADHMAVCGGQFVKIREPENFKNNNKKKETKGKPGKDIKDFFKKPYSKGSATVTSGTDRNNIFGFDNFSNTNVSHTSVKPSSIGNQVNRVTGFADLTTPSRPSTNNKPNNLGKGYVLGSGSGTGRGGGSRTGFGRGGMLANKGGGTLVVTGSQGKRKPVEQPESPNQKLRVNNFKAFGGSGFTLGGTSSTPDHSKSRLLSIGNEPVAKKQKIYETTDLKLNDPFEDDMCKCSVCNKTMLRDEIDDHMEICVGLKNLFNDTTIVDETEITDINQKYKITSCPVCDLRIEGDMDSHIEECLNASGVMNMFDEPPMQLTNDNKDSPQIVNDTNSPVQIVSLENTEKYGTTPCPVCTVNVKGDINAHLDECLNTSGVTHMFDEPPIELPDSPVQFIGNSVPKPKTDNDSDIEIMDLGETENRVACPICGMRFGISRIEDHVNYCIC